MQTSYPYDPARAIRGAKADNQYDFTLSGIARSIIPLGAGIVRMAGDKSASAQVRLPVCNTVELDYSGGSISSGDTTATVVVSYPDGSSYTITETAAFDTDKDATVSALQTKLDAHAELDASIDTTDDILTIAAADSNNDLDVSTSGDLSYAQTDDTVDELFALAMRQEGIEQTGPPITTDVTKVRIAFNQDLQSGDSFSVYVNGTAIAESFDTDHATTMSNIRSAIAAAAGVTSVVVTGSNDRIIEISGYSQLRVNSVSVTTSSGLEVTSEDITANAGGVVQYDRGTVVNAVRQGGIWVYVEDAVSPGDTPYLRFKATSNGEPGQFRSDADSSTAIAVSNATFRTGTSGAGLAILDINMP